jgi:C4-dicarboxylate-specific signal transduction histidine kinase
MNMADHPEFLKWYRGKRDGDLAGSDPGYLYWVREPNNPDVAIVLKWTRIEAAGKTMECWTALDVTELMQAQLIVQHSAKLALIGEMAAGLAHEINQPLNVIALASQNLVDMLATSCNACQRFGNTEKINRKLEKIGRQIERAAKIINNLRIFSRRDRLEVEKLDIPEQWGIAVDFVGHLLKQDLIALDTTIHPGKIEAVVNRGALQQIFVNLLTNACDSVVSCRRLGEGRIGCSIKSDERTGSAVITIEDNGAGFPKIVLDRLFEPFVTTKPRGKGTGLGLSIAHNIVSEFGGSMSVANLPPRPTENVSWTPQPAGAVVTVTLPLAKAGTR